MLKIQKFPHTRAGCRAPGHTLVSLHPPHTLCKYPIIPRWWTHYSQGQETACMTDTCLTLAPPSASLFHILQTPNPCHQTTVIQGELKGNSGIFQPGIFPIKIAIVTLCFILYTHLLCSRDLSEHGQNNACGGNVSRISINTCPELVNTESKHRK